MSHADDRRVSVGALMKARALASGADLDVLSFGGATLLMSAEAPHSMSLNRAYDVDPREPGVVAAIVERMRASGRAPLLEIAAEAMAEGDRAQLSGLGLVRRWDVVCLRADLGGLDPEAVPGVVVRDVRRDEGDAFAALALRAFGEPPPGIPRIDPAAEARTWAALCSLGRARCFYAVRDGEPCAVGVFVPVGDVAVVDGAATLEPHRGVGCQRALIDHRFREARTAGAREAISRARAGSPSQRNLERASMRVVRTFEVWGDPPR